MGLLEGTGLWGEIIVKTVQLAVEDEFYDHLIALIQQLPNDKVQIIQDGSSLNSQLKALNIHEQLMEKYASAFERLAH